MYGIPHRIRDIPYLHFFDIRDFNAMAALASLTLISITLYTILFLALIHCGYMVWKQSQAAVSPATKSFHQTLVISMTLQVIMTGLSSSNPVLASPPVNLHFYSGNAPHDFGLFWNMV